MLTLQVHKDFSTLFALKITVFFTELLSVLLTPLVLAYSLPACSGAIIDFFREFTLHVDGLGYVCSFAVFDFRARARPAGSHLATSTDATPNGTSEVPAPKRGAGPRRGRRGEANEHKMEKSFLHFKATHPDWQPDPASSVFLDRLARDVDIAKLNERDRDRSRGMPDVDPFSAPGRASSRDQGPNGKLGSMRETDEEEDDDDDEAEELGWKKKLSAHEEVESDHEMRGEGGMMGLLQEVLQRR